MTTRRSWVLLAYAVIGMAIITLWILTHDSAVNARSNAGRELRIFAVSLRSYVRHTGKIPSGAFADVLHVVSADDPLATMRMREYRGLRTGRDPWGNLYQYSVSADQRILHIWSFGSDLKDDGGKGDDINQWIDLDPSATQP